MHVHRRSAWPRAGCPPIVRTDDRTEDSRVVRPPANLGLPILRRADPAVPGSARTSIGANRSRGMKKLAIIVVAAGLAGGLAGGALESEFGGSSEDTRASIRTVVRHTAPVEHTQTP